jgi:anti-sigma factor RsiW
MQCDRAQELIGAFVDGELSGDDRPLVATHLETCPNCRELLADVKRISAAVAEMGREAAPKGLASRIRGALFSADKAQADRRRLWRISPGFLRQAAALAAVCLLSASVTWWMVTTSQQGRQLEQELVTAHVRSLLQDRPTQVASSDSHTVKPWFAGRVDFSPEVKDLAAEGFPLLGGRLDYVGERRVGALVYQRRLHVVNVFMWPASGSQEAPPRQASIHGYNLLAWTSRGITYWAVSDLAGGELQHLQALMRGPG